MTNQHINLLTPADLDAIQKELPGWELGDHGSHLYRKFVFSDFKQAFDFMGRVAQAAEAMDHHPDWCNSFNKVAITLTTHSAKGLTALDLALAKAIDQRISKP